MWNQHCGDWEKFHVDVDYEIMIETELTLGSCNKNDLNNGVKSTCF